MKRTTLNKNRLIFSDLFINELKNNPITIIDAGGRGGLEMPWNEVDGTILKVIGFEPDREECDRLNRENARQEYIPAILWSERKEMDIHITKEPSCSSVFEPNIDLIKKYENMNWESKVVNKKIKYPTTTIDIESSKRGLSIDFLKIDTHGAEYEILKGAVQALKEDIFGVLVETWTIEVYKNQPTSDRIIDFMREKGFDLFDVGIAAAWKRSGFNEIKRSKKQIIGLDLLFLKRNINSNITSDNAQKTLKAAAIAEVYGYPDYAIEILNTVMNNFPNEKKMLNEAKRIMISNFSQKEGVIGRLYKKVAEYLAGIKFIEYPKLHP